MVRSHIFQNCYETDPFCNRNTETLPAGAVFDMLQIFTADRGGYKIHTYVLAIL